MDFYLLVRLSKAFLDAIFSVDSAFAVFCYSHVTQSRLDISCMCLSRHIRSKKKFQQKGVAKWAQFWDVWGALSLVTVVRFWRFFPLLVCLFAK